MESFKGNKKRSGFEIISKDVKRSNIGFFFLKKRKGKNTRVDI